MKSVIIALHVLGIVGFYLLFRDFPFDPIPNWQKYLADLWAIIGLCGSIGLFMQKTWAKWLAIVFYLRLFVQ